MPILQTFIPIQSLFVINKVVLSIGVVCDLWQVCGFLDNPVSSLTDTDRHNITHIVLIMSLNSLTFNVVDKIRWGFKSLSYPNYNK